MIRLAVFGVVRHASVCVWVCVYGSYKQNTSLENVSQTMLLRTHLRHNETL